MMCPNQHAGKIIPLWFISNPKSKFQNQKSFGFHKLSVFKFPAEFFAVRID